MPAAENFSPSELEQRRPVWDALSTLFLDTDTALLRPFRARVLAASPFSIDELQTILIDEVYPVCSANLASIAGEWAGFDSEWLERAISRHLSSRWRGLRVLSGGRLFAVASAEWRSTKRDIRAARLSRTAN